MLPPNATSVWKCAPVKRNLLQSIALVFGGALAACGGGSAIGTPPASAPSTPPASALGTANVGISVRFSSSTASARKVQYIGAGTQAITVAVNGASPAPFACRAPGCTITLAAPLGADSFTVNAYDGALTASPAPLLISNGAATATIASNSTNAVSVAMGAVIGTGALTLSVTNRLPLVGALASTALRLAPGSLTDPDGNTIGTGALLAPVSFAPSPASSHISVSPSTITDATTPITVSYDGAAIAPVTIVAKQTITGNVVSSTASPLQIVPHTYFVFVPSYKTGCPNSSSDCLKIWSPVLNSVVGTAPVGNGSNDVAVNATLTQAYVPNTTDGTISVVDITNKEAPFLASTIPGLTAAVGIGYDTTHGRNTLYVGSDTSLAPPSKLLAVAPSGGTVQPLEATRTYLGAAVLDPTGNCLFSPVYGQNHLGNGDTTGFDVFDLVNAADRGYTSNFATASVVVAPNGATVYALTVAGGTPANVTAFPVTNPGCTLGAGSVTTQTPGVINGSGITISRDGTTIYVGGKGGNPALTRFSTAPFAVTNNDNIGGGLAIYALTVSPDGRYLFTTDNYGAASTARFHIIDLQAGGGPAEVPGSPFLNYANVVRSYP